jgi:transcriptional regulator with XRE-family HTH domain
MQAKLTQVALAELSGVRQGDISDIENGRGNPTKRTLEKLGVALNIDFVIGASSAP